MIQLFTEFLSNDCKIFMCNSVVFQLLGGGKGKDISVHEVVEGWAKIH